MICIVILYAKTITNWRAGGFAPHYRPGELRRGGTIEALGTEQGTEASERAEPPLQLGSTGSGPEYG